MKSRYFTLLIFLSGTAMPASVQQPPFDALVREDFFAGFAGDSARFESAMRLIEEMLAKDPGNAEIMSWHGAGIFFRSTTAFQKGDIPRGTSLLQAGAAEMAEAVRLAPEDPGVRIPRGAMLITATRFMQPQAARSLLEAGVDDFEAMLRVQQTKWDQLSTHSRGELLIGLADGWNRLGDTAKARQYFERIASDPQLGASVYGEKARAWLEGSVGARSPLFFECTGCHRRTDVNARGRD